jgi:hypothetical protein
MRCIILLRRTSSFLVSGLESAVDTYGCIYDQRLGFSALGYCIMGFERASGMSSYRMLHASSIDVTELT